VSRQEGVDVEHVDVLIVGAGLSGIGAAARLTLSNPARGYVILEARSASGGTWDLFRYPGIRSDSDMYTLGYRFKPWRGVKSLAEGTNILAYIRETAREYDVDRHIRYDHRVTGAAWDSTTATWTVTVDHRGQPRQLTCGLLWSCGGYYDYDAGYTPAFEGVDRFRGTLVHPQHWPEGLEYAGKRVVVIGSGATAVTLVPALATAERAEAAEHVTMLQRSPTYVVSIPGTDRLAEALRRRLPARAAYAAIRWKNIMVSSAFYRLSRRRPQLVRRWIRAGTVKALPDGYDVDTHFRPRYNPWDQRVCPVPDADLFRAIRSGRVSVVTDTIETFTERGLRLASGRELEADVVVTATGLSLVPFGGFDLTVDGSSVSLPDTMAYKALMLSGVPNFVFTVGYTNASWTLKADLVAEFVSRLLTFMRERGYRSVVPLRDPSMPIEPFMDFTSGYVVRALDLLPKQGSREPWRLRQSYLRDLRTIRRGPLEDGVLEFS
jgi:cation diffusion facilitator CzcD-associated flavoprotein CzcO